MKSVTRGHDVVRDKLEDIEFDYSAIMQELGGIDLTVDQQSRLAELMGGTKLHSELKAWVTHPNFDKAVTDYQDAVKRGATRVPKQQQRFYREIMKRIRRNRDIALRQLQYENPELQAEIQGWKMDKNTARMGGLEGLADLPIK